MLVKLSFARNGTNTYEFNRYGNIIANRHSVAHATGANMTFAELEAAMKLSGQIFDAVCMALELTDEEIADIV